MKSLKVGAAIAVALSVALGLMSGARAADAPGAQYVGNTTCKVCHNTPDTGEQWNKWKAVKHATALEALKSDAALKIAKDKGLTVPPSEAPECLKCHVTGYDPATKKAPAKIKLDDGVQCESCHGPASLHVKDGQFLKFNPDKASTIDIKAHQPPVTEDACKKCHNEESPTWNPEKYTKADGTKAGFDFEEAKKIIAHPNPKKAAEAGKS
ncbi:MAG: cytochrome C554 [Candidatus Hydrogenedentes bacterium]|nr:cytochrome C554 [Candidatus Hydrogenedentota bacterium]MBI3118058.1 cytochrome C554 [Candidatus Hydrogenedentota bacterium]